MTIFNFHLIPICFNHFCTANDQALQMTLTHTHTQTVVIVRGVLTTVSVAVSESSISPKNQQKCHLRLISVLRMVISTLSRVVFVAR